MFGNLHNFKGNSLIFFVCIMEIENFKVCFYGLCLDIIFLFFFRYVKTKKSAFMTIDIHFSMSVSSWERFQYYCKNETGVNKGGKWELSVGTNSFHPLLSLQLMKVTVLDESSGFPLIFNLLNFHADVEFFLRLELHHSFLT